MRALASLLACLALGCQGSKSAPADPDERGVSAGRAAPAPGAPETREPAADPLAPPPADRRVRIGEGTPPAQPSAPETPAADTAERPPERDLAAELRARVGDPSACLREIPDLPDEVTVTVEATVTTTGVVTRSYARAAALPDAALECIRRRLDGARLRAPIEPAPRTITTTLTLRRTQN